MNGSNGTDDGFDLPRWQSQTLPNDHSYSAQYSLTQQHQQQQRLPVMNMQPTQPPLSASSNRLSAPDTAHMSPVHPSLTRSMSIDTPSRSISHRNPRHQLEDLEASYSPDTVPNNNFYSSNAPFTSDNFHDQPSYDSRTRTQPMQPPPPITSTQKADPFAQSPSAYQSPSTYGTAYPDTPIQYQAVSSSKPTTPYLGPNVAQQQQSPSSASVQQQHQYSPSYPSALDTQVIQPPSLSISQSNRNRHIHSLSQTHLSPQQNPQYTPTTYSTVSNPSSPITYQSQSQANYFAQPSKDEIMHDTMHPSLTPGQTLRSESARDTTRDPHGYSSTSRNSSPVTAMEISQPQRRPAGLRRLRDSRDLRPVINPQPSGRRADATRPGNFLSVSSFISIYVHFLTNTSTSSLCYA